MSNDPHGDPGRVVLVAGGTGGLGRSVSLAFLASGDRVEATYRNADELAELETAAGDDSARLSGHAVDVTREEDVRALVATIVKRHGRLDALVNTVGGYGGGASLWETEASLLDRMLALNLRSGWVLSRAVAAPMIERGNGAIVNVAARAAFDHAAGLAAYAASKAAAVALIDVLAADLKGTGVRANSILPSVIDTPANRKAMPNADFSKWPRPDEIARVILFLCGDDARLVSGAAIPVYGES
jgi:NAD(P)-dependent dehydrogenase (short-subunit alcohol dehydrogenase family)